MTLLIIGLILFLVVHGSTMARGARESWIARLGEGGYKAAYSVLSLLGVVLIVWGFIQYRSSGLAAGYTPPGYGRVVGPPLLLIAFILLAAANMPAGYIRAKIQHPFLIGIALWALSHLLMNGDQGGIILFGAFLLYAVVDLFAVFQREPKALPPPTVANDIKAIVAGVVAVVVFVFVIHPYVFRIPLGM